MRVSQKGNSRTYFAKLKIGKDSKKQRRRNLADKQTTSRKWKEKSIIGQKDQVILKVRLLK